MKFGKCPRPVLMYCNRIHWSDRNVNSGPREWVRSLTTSWCESVTPFVPTMLITHSFRVRVYNSSHILALYLTQPSMSIKIRLVHYNVSTAEIMQCRPDSEGMIRTAESELLQDVILNNCAASLDNGFEWPRKTKKIIMMRELGFARDHAEDSGLLGLDAASLGEWFPTFLGLWCFQVLRSYARSWYMLWNYP
jgi:hypothetical protein